MAKVTIKGKKVKGTKKKDKINWLNQKAWKKALSVFANNGNDVINFKKSKFKNKLYGQNGNDTIYGGKGNETIDGGSGNDKLYGYNGNDKIYGGKGKDTINAGTGKNKIYHNAGDGNDVIQNGKGTDTLVVNGINPIDEITATPVGNDLVITRTNGELITLKDYMKGNHSVKYVQYGGKTVKTEQLRNLVYSGDKTVNGTPWHDDIYTTFKRVAPQEHPQVLAGAGNDNIFITEESDYPEVYLGKGNDTITLQSEKPNVRIYFENGDDNNTITGLYDGMDTSAYIYLVSNSLFRKYNFNKFDYNLNYILGTMDGDDLVLKLTGGETFTVKNYNILNEDIKTIIYSNTTVYTRPLLYDLKLEDDFVFLPETSVTITDSNSNKTIIAPDVNFARTFNISGTKNEVLIKGQNTQTINICGNENIVYAENTGSADNIANHNQVYINSNKNYVYLGGGQYSTVTIADNLNNNQITIYGAGNTVNTSAGGLGGFVTSYATGEGQSYGCNIIYLKGDRDRALLYEGDHEIHLTGNYDKYISSYKAHKVDVYGIETTDTLIWNYFDSDNYAATTFEHYAGWKDTTTNEDHISVKHLDANGNIINSNNNILNIYGTWAGIEFSLDNVTVANNIQIEARPSDGDSSRESLNELSQYVDMSKDNINHDYTLGNHILGIADSVYIKGTTDTDIYRTNCVLLDLNKKYIIDDDGGTDTFWLSQSKGSFKFFFDVNRNGKVVGSDLYIFSGDGGEVNDFMAFVTNKGNLTPDEDYIIIKNYFNPNGTNNVNTGTGYVEWIGDNNNYYAHSNLINNIAQQVSSWLSANTSYSSVSDMFDSTTTTTDQLYALGYSYTNNWTAAGNWNYYT